MKKTTTMLCALALGCGSLMAATHAKAQTDEDKKFLATAAQGDQNEIALGKLASQKASDPAVRAFGERMVKDHTQIDQNMKPFLDSWGITPPAGPDDDTKKEWDKLNGLNGKEFDKEYISMMVSDHSKDLSEFNKEVKDTKDPKFRAAVMQAKSAVAAHKNMAYDLKKKMS